MGLSISIKTLLPLSLGLAAFITGRPTLINSVRDFEGAVGPTQRFFCGGNFFNTQGRTVTTGCTLSGRRAKANDCLAANQRWLSAFTAGQLYRLFDGCSIVAVNLRDYLPTIGFKAGGGVIGKPAQDFTVDGNTIVIIKGYQFA